jgi:hypothetical protein
MGLASLWDAMLLRVGFRWSLCERRTGYHLASLRDAGREAAGLVDYAERLD